MAGASVLGRSTHIFDRKKQIKNDKRQRHNWVKYFHSVKNAEEQQFILQNYA